jgi:hypothetical protein
MASRVKVNIPRETLIETLEQRIKDLEKGTPAVAVKLEGNKKVLHDLLEKAAAELRATGHGPHYHNRGDDGIWVDLRRAWVNVRDESYGESASKRPRSSEEMVAVLKKQIKLLQLSTDDSISVGVNDELYDLL